MSELLKALFSELEQGEFIELRIKRRDRDDAAAYLCDSVEHALTVAGKATDLYHVWFGVAPRFRANNKVRRLTAIWLDVDATDFGGDLDLTLRHATDSVAFPPSCLVSSGNGYHVYWFLTEPTNPAAARKVLRAFHDAAEIGKTHDITRFLRLPGTYNPKYEPPRECKIEYIYPDLCYSISDLMNITKIDGKVLHRIVTGDTHDYPSRSERDWFVVRSLQIAQVSSEGITAIFATRPVGDKFRSETDGTHYLKFTMEKSAASLGAVTVAQREDEQELFEERLDGYWFTSSKGSIRVSSFTFKPQLLLNAYDGQVFYGTMQCEDKTWEGIALPRAAFSRVSALDKYIGDMHWQWLGNDTHLRHLQLYLLRQHERLGGQVTVGVSSLGRHGDVWVTPSGCITTNGTLPVESSPFVYLNPRHVQRDIIYEDAGAGLADIAELFAELYPTINVPEVVMPALGWFSACAIKPLIEEAGYRMPNLSVWGTKGGGKTSLIKLLLKLLGDVNPAGMYSGTTHFVTTTLVASATSIPVFLSEFRLDMDSQALRTLRSIMLMQYDTGSDARGRADQTVREYPLCAPIILDGEDIFDDAAIRERMISVNMSPENIAERSTAWRAYKELADIPIHLLALPFVRFTLAKDVDWVVDNVTEQLEHTMRVFPLKMADRVRQNIAVCLAGWRLFYEFMESLDLLFPLPTPVAFASSTSDVVNTQTGRSRSLVDDFVTDAVNHVATGGQGFRWKYSNEEGILWIHLSTAMNWWRTLRARTHMPTLGTDAIKRQLAERSEIQHPGFGQYLADVKKVIMEGTTVHAHGIRLAAALDAGLDVPETIRSREVVIKL